MSGVFSLRPVILTMAARSGGVTPTQLQEKRGGSLKSASSRLAEACAAGLLHRHRSDRGESFVYTLTDEGEQELHPTVLDFTTLETAWPLYQPRSIE